MVLFGLYLLVGHIFFLSTFHKICNLEDIREAFVTNTTVHSRKTAQVPVFWLSSIVVDRIYRLDNYPV
jgi:hypothetical protein